MPSKKPKDVTDVTSTMVGRVLANCSTPPSVGGAVISQLPIRSKCSKPHAVKAMDGGKAGALPNAAASHAGRQPDTPESERVINAACVC